MSKRIILLVLLWSISCFANVNKTALISIPKCGNFLLLKLMEEISKKRASVGSPYRPDHDWENYITINHELVNQQTIDFCRNNNVKVVFIYRDPRDQVVSAAYYFKQKGFGRGLTIAQMMTTLIPDSCYWWRLIDLPTEKGTVGDFFDFMLEWVGLDFVYATSFEKIVGPQGGGDRTVQIEEIKSIAQFCGYVVTDEEVNAIADSIWGSSHTFRQGKIGSWKNEFTPDLKNIFKNVAGQLLIDLGYEKDFNW